MKKILFLLLCLVISGCVFDMPKYILDPTPDERSYMNKVLAQPLEFEITAAEVNDVWGRAQSFIVAI